MHGHRSLLLPLLLFRDFACHSWHRKFEKHLPHFRERAQQSESPRRQHNDDTPIDFARVKAFVAWYWAWPPLTA